MLRYFHSWRYAFIHVLLLMTDCQDLIEYCWIGWEKLKSWRKNTTKKGGGGQDYKEIMNVLKNLRSIKYNENIICKLKCWITLPFIKQRDEQKLDNLEECYCSRLNQGLYLYTYMRIRVICAAWLRPITVDQGKYKRECQTWKREIFREIRKGKTRESRREDKGE